MAAKPLAIPSGGRTGWDHSGACVVSMLDLNTIAILVGLAIQAGALIWVLSAMNSKINTNKDDITKVEVRQDKAETGQLDVVKTLAELSERSRIQTETLKSVSDDLRAFLRASLPVVKP